MTFYVRCAKCATFGICEPHHGNFIPCPPKDWTGLHAVGSELNTASDFLGFVCPKCKGGVLGAIKHQLPRREEP